MTATAPDAPTAPPAARDAEENFYYGWTIVLVGAIGMAATLPGRTFGLGLITERMMAELSVSKTTFGFWNLYATLLGALACVPCGWLIDRLGSRIVLSAVTAALGATVLAMTRTTDPTAMFWLLVGTRAFGQSMLSVASLTIVEKWFQKRIGPAMGLFAIVMTIGMVVGLGVMQAKILDENAWRPAWENCGYGVLVAAALALIFGRDLPTDRSLEFSSATESAGTAAAPAASATWRQALATPAFWTIALAVSFFGLTHSGVTLFQQSVMRERGFDEAFFQTTQIVGLVVGLVANLGFGALSARVPLGKLLAVAMAVLAGAYVAFPHVATVAQAYAYTVAHAVGGGAATVVFFAAWAHAFGPREVGRIQGAAQLLSVVASALGPVVVAVLAEEYRSYDPAFWLFAGVAALFAVLAWITPVPDARRGAWSKDEENSPDVQAANAT